MCACCRLLSGKEVACDLLLEVKEAVSKLSGRPPCVVFLRVGNADASVAYVNQKKKRAAEVGIRSLLKVFDSETTTEQMLIDEVKRLNEDASVDGILVQAPLPNSMDFIKVINTIAPEKDVDGFCSINMGRLIQSEPAISPCTPAGIIELLKYYNVETAGKHVVIVNRSLIVGKPLSALLLRHGVLGDATVTVCHSRTKDLRSITQQADILILACGRPCCFDRSYVKKGAVVVDVGISRVPAQNERGYVLHGDANFEDLKGYVAAITPVPGGVGPMTVAMLMKNTLKAYHLCHH